MNNELNYPEEMEQYFNKRADGYDNHMKKTVTSFNDFYKKLSDPIRRNNSNIEILDLGCKKENRTSIFIFFGTVIFVFVVYQVFDKWNSWTAFIDTITTAIFFVGMWLMAKRKVENWIYWIIGDIISVPLYFYKGFTFTSFQYLIFTILAIYGYNAWKKNISKNLQIS